MARRGWQGDKYSGWELLVDVIAKSKQAGTVAAAIITRTQQGRQKEEWRRRPHLRSYTSSGAHMSKWKHNMESKKEEQLINKPSRSPSSDGDSMCNPRTHSLYIPRRQRMTPLDTSFSARRSTSRRHIRRWRGPPSRRVLLPSPVLAEP